jgi:hypothetical protein
MGYRTRPLLFVVKPAILFYACFTSDLLCFASKNRILVVDFTQSPEFFAAGAGPPADGRVRKKKQ